LKLPYINNLAGEFFRWEFAIAIACSILGVNAFDQPDVQDNKDRTRQKIETFHQLGELPESEVIWERADKKIFGQTFKGLEQCASVSEVIDAFTALAEKGSYIAVNAYLPREAGVEAKLQQLRKGILEKTGCATTLGFGPRFLHSTGQLHKGGPKTGLFLQITQGDVEDLPIPGEKLTFGILARAQAKGDLEALLARGQRAIRVHMPAGDPLDF
jgi:transaldolase/glucose-6-phosphate isomerase